MSVRITIVVLIDMLQGFLDDVSRNDRYLAYVSVLVCLFVYDAYEPRS